MITLHDTKTILYSYLLTGYGGKNEDKFDRSKKIITTKCDYSNTYYKH